MTRYETTLTIGLLLIFSGLACNRHVSNREIFNRAMAAANATGGELRWYIIGEIAKAQAKQGAYDDALRALDLIQSPLAVDLLADLASIRAKNGDVPGAKAFARSRFAEQRCLQAIALAQIELGDIRGATETAEPLRPSDRQSVLQAVGFHYVELGDFTSALETADMMQQGSLQDDEVRVAVVDKLRERGENSKARRIERRIIYSDFVPFLRDRRRRSPEPRFVDSCGLAWEKSNSENLESALNVLSGRKCDCRTMAAIHADYGDAAGAEEALLTCSHRSYARGVMAELANWHAAKGNFTLAMRFEKGAEAINDGLGGEGDLATALRLIARDWAARDRRAALKWAESKPDGYERAMALLGVAEAGTRLRDTNNPEPK